MPGRTARTRPPPPARRRTRRPAHCGRAAAERSKTAAAASKESAPRCARSTSSWLPAFARAQLEQRVDADGGHRQHSDLAERIETAEVHQDDVDDVAAVRQRLALLGKILRDGRVG